MTKTNLFFLIIVLTAMIATLDFFSTPNAGSAISILPGQVEQIKPIRPPKPFTPIYPPIEPIRPGCPSGERRCVGNNLEGCVAGEWEVMATCRPGSRCTPSGCQPFVQPCPAGQRRCVGNNLQGCIAGEWEVMATCKPGTQCTISGCQQTQPTCRTGARHCSGNNLEGCIDGQWEVMATCDQTYQYCTKQGCISIPPNIVIVAGPQGLYCPTQPSILDINWPELVYKNTDCELTAAKIESYLNILENAVTTCSQAQQQQINLAAADEQYIDYQIDLIAPGFPLPPPPYPTMCSLVPQTLTQTTPSFTPKKGTQYFTDWLNYITQTAQQYCTQIQNLVSPVINGCTNINANIPACGTDFNAIVMYHQYLEGQMAYANNMASQAIGLNSAFTLNVNQLRTALAKEGVKC